MDDGWEWHPDLVRLTADLEGRYEAALRADVGLLPAVTPGPIATGLRQLLDAADGPSLSSFLESHGTLDQLREFAIHRSAYQRKEADPHTWALPRLSGRAKAAIIEIQSDEYGNGRPVRPTPTSSPTRWSPSTSIRPTARMSTTCPA